MSYNIDNLSFTIFGSGHDYTLLDSGDGEVQIFSHPFVPLGSTNYAGQYYFIVPDENGDPIDAVKDDIAHCTFSPAIGATFDTAGELEVSCHYHREYIYAEETIVVDKEVKQIIEVVDHGTVASSSGTCDLYTDGYLFFRPSTIYTAIAEKMFVYSALSGTKVSSFPWRVTELGNNTGYAFVSASVTDIDELQFADTSNVTGIFNFLNGADVVDYAPLAGWDVSKVTRIYRLGFGNSSLEDVSALAKWNTESLERIDALFEKCYALTSLHGLEDWDVSNVWNMSTMCYQCTALSDISALTRWKTTNLTTLANAFNGCTSLKNITGLENFDITKLQNLNRFMSSCGVKSLVPLLGWSGENAITDMSYSFTYCGNLLDYHGLENLDTSHVTTFRECFNGNQKVLSIEGVENFNVSSATNLRTMFGDNFWNSSIEPIENWTFASGANCSSMFWGCYDLLSVSDADLDLSNCSDISSMFSTLPMYWSQLLGRKCWKDYYGWHDYNGFVTEPVEDVDHPAIPYTKDASNAQNWIVSGTGLSAFDSYWSYIPSWN